MATPMTPTQVVSQLKKWGVPFKEYRSWKTHNRNHKGAWGPVNGFMVHHTGSDAKDQRDLLYNGISGLPGPLCHFGLAQDGTVHLIGWGRANHAGAGDPDVLSAVIDERPAPVDNESSVDFNSRFYGVEVWYSGNHEMTDAQYKTLLKLSAAVLDFHGWGKYSVIGHGESGSPGKWDPGYAPGKMMNMDKVRTDVGGVLNSGPKKSTPVNSSTKETSMEPVNVWAYKGNSKLKSDGGGKETEDAYNYLRTIRHELRDFARYGGWDYKGKTNYQGTGPETKDAYAYLRGIDDKLNKLVGLLTEVLEGK